MKGLDEHITGNYGADQYNEKLEKDFENWLDSADYDTIVSASGLTESHIDNICYERGIEVDDAGAIIEHLTEYKLTAIQEYFESLID